MARKQFYLVQRKDRLTKDLNGRLRPTFYYRWYDEAGKPHLESTGQTSKTRAEIEAQKNLNKQTLPGTNKTLEKYAEDFFVAGKCSWLKRQKAKGRQISDAWARAKRRLLVNHVFPALGKCKLDKLTRPMIERFLVGLPRSCQTRNHLLYTLKTVLAEAEADGLIAKNPLEHAEPLGKQARKRDVFSLEELQRLFPQTREGLLAVWGELKYAALYMTLATTGIREGEARALCWKHILPEGWLVVAQAVKEGGEIGSPKSGDTRIAAIPGRTKRVIEWWRTESPFKGSEDLVFFGDRADHPLNRRTFQDILSRALEGDHRDDASKPSRIEHNERFLTTHSFRHTYNTMMRRTIPADTLRALVGHRDARMTEHYDHPQIADLVKSLEGSRPAIEKAIKW